MVQNVVGAAVLSANATDITSRHFGSVVKSGDTNFGRTLVEGSNIDKGLDYLGITSIRYPGGTESHEDFSIIDPADVAGLKRAIDYCAANKLLLNFTLNDTIYVDPATGLASITTTQRAELISFLQNDLIGYADAVGVPI